MSIDKLNACENMSLKSKTIPDNILRNVGVTESVLEPFLEEPKYDTYLDVSRKNDSCCIRFLRKKYQCFIIYTLLLIVFIQNIVPLLEKDFIYDILDKFMKKDSQNMSNICNYTNQFD